MISWRFVSPSSRRRFATGMTYEYVAVVTPLKFRVTWATSWGRLQGFVDFIKNWKRQLWVRPMGGWNSTLQAAWYVRHAHWARLCYIPFVIWCLWIKPAAWLLIPSSTSFMAGRSRNLYFIKILKNVICEYEQWVIETQLCKLHNRQLWVRSIEWLKLNNVSCEYDLQ